MRQAFLWERGHVSGLGDVSKPSAGGSREGLTGEVSGRLALVGVTFQKETDQNTGKMRKVQRTGGGRG